MGTLLQRPNDLCWLHLTRHQLHHAAVPNERFDLVPPEGLVCVEQSCDHVNGSRNRSLAQERKRDLQYAAMPVVERDEDGPLRQRRFAAPCRQHIRHRHWLQALTHVLHLRCERLGIHYRVVRKNGERRARAALVKRLDGRPCEGAI